MLINFLTKPPIFMVNAETVGWQMSKTKSSGVSILAGLGRRMASYVEPYKKFLEHPQKQEHLGHMMIGLTTMPVG